jgi:HEAT repeat protein
MTDKKTGLLFPEVGKTSQKAAPRKARRKTSKETALKKIQETRDKQTRKKIIAGIVKSREPWICEVLIESLDDPSEDIRKIIVKELSNREDLDLNLLYHRLHKSPWFVKTGCLRILGLRKNASAVKYIESMVNDPNIEVRRTLAVILGEIGGKKALALLTILSEDASSFVKKAAMQALQEVSQVKFT